MKHLNEMLFTISNGLLVPTVLLLMSFFLIALVNSSKLIKESFKRKWIEKLFAKKEIVRLEDKDSTKENLLLSALLELQQCQNEILAEKTVEDFALELEKKLFIHKTLTRTGPMLGLMGTLIPMGPALLGLSQGDVSTMAANMQLAFSTTVVGVVVGGLGYVNLIVRQRWHKQEIDFLFFQKELLFINTNFLKHEIFEVEEKI